MLKSQKTIGKARVLFPFKAQNRDELNLKVDDVVNVLQKDLPDDGWWLGEVNGVVGVFPDNFVRLIPEMHQQQKSQKDTNGCTDDDDTFDCMKSSSSKLKHITATRVKAPQRRLPSRLSSKVSNDHSSSSSVVSVVSNKKSISVTNAVAKSGMPVSKKSSHNELLDSCWGNTQDSPDSTFTSPRLYSSESPSESLPFAPPLSQQPSLCSVPSFNKQFKHSPKVVCSNSFVSNNSSPRAEKEKYFHGRGRDYEREGVGDKETVGSKLLMRKSLDIKNTNGCMSLDDFRHLQKEVSSLQNDVREQGQTNERMLQTLRNFLHEEKDKVRALACEFEGIKKAVLKDITFL